MERARGPGAPRHAHRHPWPRGAPGARTSGSGGGWPADAYRVRVVADPTTDAAPVQAQIRRLPGRSGSARPPGARRLGHRGPVRDHPGGVRATSRRRTRSSWPAVHGAAEGRGAHPRRRGTHGRRNWIPGPSAPRTAARLSALALRRGALYEPVPGWLGRSAADLSAVTVSRSWACTAPADPVSPLAQCARPVRRAGRWRNWSASQAARHDALNDRHRPQRRRDHRAVPGADPAGRRRGAHPGTG